MFLLQERLAAILAAKGMKAAELTRLSGINISRLLNSDSSPQLSTVNRLAKALQIPESWLTDPQAFPPSAEDLQRNGLNLSSEQMRAGTAPSSTFRSKSLANHYVRDYQLELPIVEWQSMFCEDPYLSQSGGSLICPYKASERSFCVRPSFAARPVFSMRDFLFVDPDSYPGPDEYVIVGDKIDSEEQLRPGLERLYSTLHLLRCGFDGRGMFFAPLDTRSPLKSFYFNPNEHGIVGLVIGRYSDMRGGSFFSA